MGDRRKYGFVLSSPTEETLPPYSSTWGSDVTEDKRSTRINWTSPDAWTSKCRTATEKSKVALDKTWNFSRDQTWPMVKKISPSLKQWTAFFLVVALGIVPLALLGYYTPIGENEPGERPFYGIFQDKVLGCGDSFGVPENATVTGIEKLFVLDKTFGRFTFSQVKTLDVAWDVLVGRGVQLLAWWTGYNVFSNALLRVIEWHTASFRVFQQLALEGPSLLSLWTLVKELWCAKSKRTRFLFFYMWLSTTYIICIPMLLSAMTGYDATSVSWVSLDNSNNIVPSSTLERTLLVSGTWSKTFDEPVCVDYTLYWSVSEARRMRSDLCNCQLPNGTTFTPEARNRWQYGSMYAVSYGLNCRYNFPGNNQTFNKRLYDPTLEDEILPCATSFDITIGGEAYDALDLNSTIGWCHDSDAYQYMYLYDRTRCLPDTANPSYQWGFSTMLSGLFIFFHFSWVITMYIVWQDAQLNSSLVKSGYKMTPLRAAFTMAKAAKQKTGMGNKQLVRANMREIEQELYGTRKTTGTRVDYGIFAEVDEEDGDAQNTLTLRNVAPKHDAGFSEVLQGSGSSSKSTTSS